MTHIGMIDEHIMRKNPDILAMTEFQSEERTVLTAAYELLYTFEEADRPFIRFYLDHQECYVLQSKNYNELYAVARAIAALDNPNISNINVRNDESYKELKERVRIYMAQKRSVGPLNAAEAFSNILCKESKSYFMTQMMSLGTETLVRPIEEPLPDLR